MDSYIKGKGVYVGTFTEKDLEAGKDKKAIEEKMHETGLQYIHSDVLKKNGKPVGLKVYVCSVYDM